MNEQCEMQTSAEGRRGRCKPQGEGRGKWVLSADVLYEKLKPFPSYVSPPQIDELQHILALYGTIGIPISKMIPNNREIKKEFNPTSTFEFKK